MSKLTQAKTDLRYFKILISEKEKELEYRFLSDWDRSETEKELKQLNRLITYTENYISKLESEQSQKPALSGGFLGADRTVFNEYGSRNVMLCRSVIPVVLDADLWVTETS